MSTEKEKSSPSWIIHVARHRSLNSTTRAAHWVSELWTMVRRQEVFFCQSRLEELLCIRANRSYVEIVTRWRKVAILCIFFTPRFTSTRDATIRSSHQPPRSLPDVGSSPEHRLPLAGVSHKPLLLRRARARAQPCLPAAHRPPSTTSSHPACELVVDRLQAAPWSAPAGACQSEWPHDLIHVHRGFLLWEESSLPWAPLRLHQLIPLDAPLSIDLPGVCNPLPLQLCSDTSLIILTSSPTSPPTPLPASCGRAVRRPLCPYLLLPPLPLFPPPPRPPLPLPLLNGRQRTSHGRTCRSRRRSPL
jgi:hypothetical protein